MPEDPVARAKYVAAYKPTFVRNYRTWEREQCKERDGPLDDDSDLSAEDIDGLDTDRDRTLSRVSMVSRSSTCTRGESSRRSRSPLRTRHTHPPASEQRRPPAQHAKPYPWAPQSRISQSVRAEAPVRAESRVRTVSPRDQSAASRYPQAAHAKYVVMSASQVRFR